MDKVFKLLNKYNKNYLYKEKDNKKSVKFYAKTFKRQNIYIKVNNDFDYIDFSIIRTSYENMKTIQNEFFNIKESLRDLWSVISYKEKHFLVYQKLGPFLDTLKCFYVDDKRYFITYFDNLVNAYYDHDMLMFTNDNYRKYLYDYSKISSNENLYGIIPIQAGFAQMDYILGDEDNYVMYNKRNKRFYYVNEERKVSVGVTRVLEDEEIKQLSLIIREDDQLAFVKYLIKHDIGNKKLMKKLNKLNRKLEKKLASK